MSLLAVALTAVTTLGASAGAVDVPPSAQGDCVANEWKGEPAGTPLEFLEFLQGRSACRQAVDRFVFTVWSRWRRWIREEDLPALVALVDSRRPCPHTASALSSWAPLKPSFVGQEALFLIDGFREGVFPPSLHSEGYYRKRDRILAWWKSRQASRRTSSIGVAQTSLLKVRSTSFDP
jgi:hypothetical protein